MQEQTFKHKQITYKINQTGKIVQRHLQQVIQQDYKWTRTKNVRSQNQASKRTQLYVTRTQNVRSQNQASERTQLYVTRVFFPFIIISQLQRPIKLKFSQVCYFMPVKASLWQLPIVSISVLKQGHKYKISNYIVVGNEMIIVASTIKPTL